MGKDGYQKVANKKDLQEGSLLKVEPEGKPIVLSLVNGKVYAMDVNTCLDIKVISIRITEYKLY
jgi:nitrite reductase/ring-hydroxylating ferredoxin subunit